MKPHVQNNFKYCIIEAIENANLRNNVKIMVGGAPVSERYAQTIGAGSYSSNASEEIERAISLLSFMKLLLFKKKEFFTIIMYEGKR